MNIPGYKRLLTEEYWKISDNEFPKVIKDVLDTVKNGKIELVDIVKLYAYFMYFIDKKLIDYDKETIKSTFLNGMNIASLESSYCKNPKEELSTTYFDENSYDMKEILDKLIFKYSDPFQIFQRLSCASNEDIVTIKEKLISRANKNIVTIKEKLISRANKNKKLVKEESENMHKLCQVIDDYVSGKKTTIKTVILSDFSNEIKEELSHLAN